MRKELQAVVDALLLASERSKTVTLDAIGEAIGTKAVGTPEVDAIVTALEARGRRILAPEGQRGESYLRDVIAAARALKNELGRTPTPAEIAARSGLDERDVRHALELAKIMQR